MRYVYGRVCIPAADQYDYLTVLNQLTTTHQLVIEIRVNLNETDRLALGLSTGKTSEDQFIENHENLINDAESALEILKEMGVGH